MVCGKRVQGVNVCCVSIFLVIGTVLVVLGAVVWPIVDTVLRNELNKMMPLSNGSEAYAAWQDPMSQADAFLNFYVYDIQNPAEVLKGDKPVLLQKGPYVYKESKVKDHIHFNDNSTVQYYQTQSYVFDKSKSVGPESDRFTTINIPAYAIDYILKNEFNIIKEVMDLILENLSGEKLFIDLTVKDLVWGYPDPFLQIIKNFTVAHNYSFPIPDEFGLFMGRNGSNDGLYNIYTGHNDLRKFAAIDTWDRSRYLNFWPEDACNMINGTDGTMYHPFIETSEVLSVFSTDICRSIGLTFHSKITLKSVHLYRFKPPASLFAYPPENPANGCFCVNGECPLNGVLDAGPCHSGAPLFISQPHFLNADLSYLNAVYGLNPSDELHNTFLDVEPNLGVVFHGSKRLQMNVPLTNISHIRNTEHLPPPFLLPVLWIDENAVVTQASLDAYQSQIGNMLYLAQFFQTLLIVLGGLLICSTIAYIIAKVRSHRKDKKLVVNEPDETTHLLDSQPSCSSSGTH